MAMRKLIVGENDFQTCAPDLMKEWNWNKNDILPDSFHIGQNKRVWWICSACGHEWEALTQNRLPGPRKGNGCPKCAEKKRLETHMRKMEQSSENLATVCPEVAAEWHPTKNITSPYTPYNVSAKSQHKVWWLGKCGHEWQAAISSRAYGCGCPECKGKKISQKNLQRIIEAGTTLAKMYPEIASEWHPTKNENLSQNPDTISAGSGIKVWWLCSKCGYEWLAQINSRTTQKTGCKICSKKRALETRRKAVEASSNTLALLYPDTAAEWNWEKNIDLPITPNNVSPNSNYKVWWKCSLGHEWQTAIVSRCKGKTKCPVCSHRIKLADGDPTSEESRKILLKCTKSLLTEYPEIASEWHPAKNGNLIPGLMAPHSSKIVWWKCTKGHEWQMRIATRTGKKKGGCPICSEERRTSFPEYAVFYYVKELAPDAVHSYLFYERLELDVFIPSIKVGIEYDGYYYHKNTLNRDIKKNAKCKEEGIRLYRLRENLNGLNDYSVDISFKPKELDIAIGKLMYNIFGHTISIDTDRDFIKISELRELNEKENSLSKKCPELVKEWCQEKNGGISPDVVSYGSGKKYWWKCSFGHEYQSNIPHRIAGTGCPFCANNSLLKGFNDLETLFPDMASEWHKEKNGELQPSDVIAYTPKKVWWLGKCGHEWQAQVNTRSVYNSGCPVCCNRIIIPGFNDLADWCNKQEMQHLINEWDVEKNEGLLPSMVSPGSSRRVWWKCQKCGNGWRISISDRTGYKKSGCPYCGNKKIKAGFNDLLTSEPELCKEWDYDKNVEVSPSEVSYSSGRKVWWKCSHGHEWRATIDNRRGKGKGCPYCKNFKVWRGYNDLKTCYPEVASEWNYKKNEPLVPENVVYGSNKKVWWIGKCGHEWQAMITCRTLRNSGCPICKRRKLNSK